MNEKEFAKFLIEKKKVLSSTDIKSCFEIQQAMTKWGIKKTIDKIITEKGFLDAKQIDALVKEFAGGDEELIPGYRIVKKLGEGAMGEVYRALDLANDRSVAIKILYPHLGKRKATAQRFIQEANLCIEKLDHPNIVKGYEVGYEGTNDLFYYAMELIEGDNLRKRLKRLGVFSERFALKILLQIASALQQAHEHNLVHRDIKPDNIMLTPDDNAKLCDLGLARDWTADLSLTRTGAVMGTPFYISPEAAAGLELDSRSDIYSLGATLYHIVVGAVPFDGPNSAIVLNKQRFDPLIPPKEHRENLSAAFSAIIEKMMEKSPDDRYQQPIEIIEDVQQFMRGETPKALMAKKGKVIETFQKSQKYITEVLQAIPATTDETPMPLKEDKRKADIETLTLDEKTTSPKKKPFLDTVEEYFIEEENEKQGEDEASKNLLKKFFTSTEQRALSNSQNAQSKLIAIGAVLALGILMVAGVLIFFLGKLIGAF